MHCMQHADEQSVVSAVVDGLAGDAAMGALRAAAGGHIVAVRLLMPAEESGCRCGCGSAGPSMVAVDPQDRTLPAAQHAALRDLAPGVAVADTAWPALLGGAIALVGRNVRIATLAELSDDDGPGPIVLLLSDLVVSLAASRPEHLPSLITLALVCGHSSHTLAGAGWTVLPGRSQDVAIRTGLPVPASRELVAR